MRGIFCTFDAVLVQNHTSKFDKTLLLYNACEYMYNTYAKKVSKLLCCYYDNSQKLDQREVKKMRKYEIMYILKADLDEAGRAEENAKLAKILTDNGAEVTKTDETLLGLRDLAYPIKDQTKGYYVVLKVTMDNAAINEFNRLVRIDNNVLRHLITVDHE